MTFHSVLATKMGQVPADSCTDHVKHIQAKHKRPNIWRGKLFLVLTVHLCW